MLRKFVLAAAVAAGLSLTAAPSWAAAASTPSVAAVSSSAACVPGSPCAAALCPPGTVCVPAPKQCFTLPCPQFDCVRVDDYSRWGRWSPWDRWGRRASLLNLDLRLGLRLL
ncbi:hypothetical protein [Microtetraspora fusca]|uniref:hypothetical protein n=1 Tax=Microtetraspora fusca TaxID=1997 RepID=UPI000834098E|nr:hypothetical protein [Microtetraspora fusca]